MQNSLFDFVDFVANGMWKNPVHWLSGNKYHLRGPLEDAIEYMNKYYLQYYLSFLFLILLQLQFMWTWILYCVH